MQRPALYRYQDMCIRGGCFWPCARSIRAAFTRLMIFLLWLMQCVESHVIRFAGFNQTALVVLQVNSFRNQVLFKSAAERLPEGAILLEIGPHAILRSLLHQTRCVMPHTTSG